MRQYTWLSCEVVDAAERLRRVLATQWPGQPLDDWSTPCRIDVVDPNDDKKKPGTMVGLEELGRVMMSQTNRRVEAGLNRLGAEGWELFAVKEHTFYFKRRRH
jgi:hypothetical protein